MRASTRSAIAIVLLAMSWVTAVTAVSGLPVHGGYNEDFTAVSGGDIPRNISSLLGFDDLYGMGLNGSGVSIAVLDTGINGYHLDLKNGINISTSLIVVNQSFVPLESPMDLDGHGTFVAGMLIGNGAESSGSVVGMVPASEIWNVKVLDQVGEGEESWLVNAMDWILAQDPKPDIVSLSLGADGVLPNVESRIKQLWDAGVIVVSASGNGGPDYYTVNSPGTVLEGITVGACSTDEYLMAFSSEGPTDPGYLYKPEVVAFGLDLISTHVSGGYAQGSGTSFSVPFIDAGIALIEQATSKAYTPDEIKAAIVESSTPLGYTYFMDGAGLPNFSMALDLLEDTGWDGWGILPREITFPISNKDDTPSGNELEPYLMKTTVINSRYDGDITVSIAGDIVDFTSVSLEGYEGGKDQFVIKIQMIDTSSSFKSGTGTITIKGESDEVLVTISVTVNAPGAEWIQYVIVAAVIALLVGIVVTFAIAYNRGSRAMPYNRCEMEGICPTS